MASDRLRIPRERLMAWLMLTQARERSVAAAETQNS